MAKHRNKLLQLLAVAPEETFDDTWPFEARYTEAPGFRMHYVDEGQGETDTREEERGEFTYKIKVRAAWFEGRSDSSRRASVFKLAGDLYKLRSLAVHNGRITGDDWTEHKAGQRLEEGASLVASVLRKALTDPKPDWKSVALDVLE